MRPDLRRLANECEVDVTDGEPGFTRQPDGMFDEARRGRAAPLRVARRKVQADVTCASGAENGIDDRVQTDIGVAVAGEAALVRDAHAAQPQLLAVREAVDV